MIDKSFLEKVESMSAPILHQLYDVTYSSKALNKVLPPMTKEISVNSLSSVIDFCEHEIDNERHVLHVVDHSTVVLLGPLFESHRVREQFITASAFESKFSFGQFYNVDEFIINLQAQFVQDDTTAQILKLVGNMTRVSEVGTKDDGVTQRVEAKSGLAKVENISVPNPVTLAPYRTFVEIDQPKSNFVLRLNENHKCALFEADGGAWKIEAMQLISEYLDNGLKSIGKRDQITILS